MSFLGNLLAAGISSGVIPNLLKGAGDVVGDIVGGIQRGEKLSPGLIGGALARGAASTVGRILAPKAHGEQPIRVMTPSGSSAANARGMLVPQSAANGRLVMQPSAPAAAGGRIETDAWIDEHIVDDDAAWQQVIGGVTESDEGLADLLARFREYIRRGGRRAALLKPAVKALAAEQKQRGVGHAEPKPKKFRNYYPKEESEGRRPRRRQ